MNALPKALAFAAFACAAQHAISQTPTGKASMVYVPAGDLGDAVESLAKQTGLNVLYPGDLLDGRRTPGVEGIRTPKEAFATLLEGSPLLATEERGGFRIAKASMPVVMAAAPVTVATPASVAPPAAWQRREFRLSCRGCDFKDELKRVLQQLGATDVWADARNASFLSLTPVGEAKGGPAQSQLTRHWEMVTLGSSDNTSVRSMIEVPPVLFAQLRDVVLPRFTTRNLRDERGRITVDVLVPGEGPGVAECHKTLQNGAVQRYCGKPEQWQDLQTRVGFSCKLEGRSNELCATASEWKRERLRQSTLRSLQYRGYNDEATASIERNHPSVTVTPSVSAPVNPPPAPTPAQ